MADQDDKKNVPAGDSEVSPPLETPEEEEPVALSRDSQNILKDFDQSNLEVATMPESSELQERRRKTKNRLKELAEVGDENDSEEDGEAFENEEGGLMDLLKEANLSKKHVGFCCGGVLVIFLLAGLIYGGIKAWDAWQARPHDTTPTETETETPTTVSSYPDASLEAGIMVGQDTGETDAGTTTGEDLGEAASSGDELTQLIVDFSKMYEASQVDVNQLLDQSTDRSKALAEYEQQLNYLIYVGQQNEERLIGESSALVEDFQKLEDQRDTQENLFFDRLRQLDAYASTAALNSYVAEEQQVIHLRAQYQARQKLLGYYQAILENLQTRATDVSLNEEALIKGIKVVEVEGSDIDLIIKESDL